MGGQVQGLHSGIKAQLCLLSHTASRHGHVPFLRPDATCTACQQLHERELAIALTPKSKKSHNAPYTLSPSTKNSQTTAVRNCDYTEGNISAHQLSFISETVYAGKAELFVGLCSEREWDGYFSMP